MCNKLEKNGPCVCVWVEEMKWSKFQLNSRHKSSFSEHFAVPLVVLVVLVETKGN